MDIANRRGHKDSPQAIVYRIKAIASLNQRMMDQQLSTSDGTIAAVGIMAGLDVRTLRLLSN
jgi:hypothetical protein